MLDKFLGVDHLSCSVKDFRVVNTDIRAVKPFIIANHYSHSCHVVGAPISFSLMHENDMIGAMVYGYTAMVGQWKSFMDYGVEKESDMVELRRLVCIDDTPRNTESYFIGNTIRWLKKNTDFKIIVSYADPHHGHAGTIYKASNFNHTGMSSPGKIIDWNGRRYHDKSIRDYNRTIFKKTGERVLLPMAVKLRKALDDGEAHMVTTPGKHIYVYDLR
jgi:hypothetical protein